jgi:hypothetical protein
MALFRSREEITAASRRGDSLYSIYKTLEQSSFFLESEQKNGFRNFI